MNLRFEWNPRKATANLAMHGVSFDEALTVFADPLARIFDDEDHSLTECREIVIGRSRMERLLLVSSPFAVMEFGFSAREKPREGSVRIMKKTSSRKKSRTSNSEMRREYRFDYSKAKPNRFASRMKAGTVAIILDPDVAAVFDSSESVNALLRSVISALEPKARVGGL